MLAASDLRFRSATDDDVDALVALWSAVGMGGGPETDRHEIRQRLATVDDFFIVGERDGHLAVTAMGCYDGHRGHVKRVAVVPSEQGQGLGQAVMDEVERRFLAAGVTKLRLQVWRENERGGAFWEARGWQELPDIRYFTKDLLGAPDDGC